jgi:predicted nuclease with TOPRIM domain
VHTRGEITLQSDLPVYISKNLKRCALGETEYIDISFDIIPSCHIKWARHHCMARPQVADGGDGLQIWRVAANVLNKESRTAESG